ncbi:MAG: iron-containing alcohol dehydrogenase [Lachnospiraceae bacterium]|nr:iron-containing alcohol dehydrogenase [Lachnospiraceae bacterium]
MNSYSFGIPQSIIVGNGKFEKLPEVVEKLGGSNAMIISGPHLNRIGVVDSAMESLQKAGISASKFTDVEGNPSTTTVEKAVEAYHAAASDFIIALGGGSPMDVAKAVAVVAKYGGNICDYEGGGKVPGPVIPIIAIPTTAGTGSEVTAFSVITDHERDYKLTVFSNALIPAYAILDPQLITSVPPNVAAACGIDAFIHAEEAYVSRAANPYSEAMSEKAMELIIESIRAYVSCRENIETAEKMLLGSTLAGLAFSNARLGNVHAMSHPISAYFDVPHGVANGVLFPTIVEYNALADKGKYRKIYNIISKGKLTEEDFHPCYLTKKIEILCRDIGIPSTLGEAVNTSRKIPFAKSDIEKVIPLMAQDAMKSGNILVNPRSSNINDIISLYQKVL